jgi:SAM-dependent methyltransferase/predicted GNAT family acetyltransferase
MSNEPNEPRGERIKDAVRQGYSQRLAGGSCCGPAPASGEAGCGCGALPTLGYSSAEIEGLPRGAVVNAFGCGNPAAFSEVREGDTVLDVGSGAGIDCLIAARRVGASGRVIGIDMTPAMIATARENARQAGAANVEFRLGDAEAMPVDDGSVDWVISNCVINLAPDKGKVFREVARALKPGGRVAVSDIVFADDAPELPAALAADPELYVACVAGAIREKAYLAAMREAGLVDVAVTQRMVYDQDSIGAFFRDTLERLGGGTRLEGFLGGLKDAVAGRVWSARFVARKPGAPPRTPGGVAAVAIEDAGPNDPASIAEILGAVGLPTAGVAGSRGRFVVAREGKEVVGCAGLEVYGNTVLLRSLAVLPAYRGRGLGGRLAREIVERARRLGARQALLLTTSVAAMAAAMGFEAIPRDQVPAEVRDSWEFKADCCGAATCMRMTFGE